MIEVEDDDFYNTQPKVITSDDDRGDVVGPNDIEIDFADVNLDQENIDMEMEVKAIRTE